MYRTHFDPYIGEDGDVADYTSCGILIGDEYNITTDWDEVDCKRCLAMKDKLIQWAEETESVILEQMGGFVEANKDDT